MTHKDKLIKLAARIALDNTGPHVYLQDYKNRPKHIPVKWWREVQNKINDLEEQHKLWAIEIREIANSLPETEINNSTQRQHNRNRKKQEMKINVELLDECRLLTTSDGGISLDHLSTDLFVRVPKLRSRDKMLRIAIDVLQCGLKHL